MNQITNDEIKKDKQLSRFLSKILRHKPEMIGICLDNEGWVDVSVLLQALSQTNHPIDRQRLEYIVANNDKQRFAFDESKQKIRASQGHSVNICLNLSPSTPPDVLYHGTAKQVLGKILVEGLNRQARQYVHLSQDMQTAIKVGRRHGEPVVLIVLAGQMLQDGRVFYCSDNGVWLTDCVPVEYLTIASDVKI